MTDRFESFQKVAVSLFGALFVTALFALTSIPVVPVA
jgi:hypothetical protein